LKLYSAAPAVAVRVTDVPAQTVVELAASAGVAGFGFTFIVNVCGVPEQVPIFGVTVTVEVIAEAVLLAAVKLLMSLVPEAARPVAVLLFVHAYVTAGFVFVIDVPKVIAETVSPLHTVMSDTGFTFGTGFTFI
jgi:hypothetical protein